MDIPENSNSPWDKEWNELLKCFEEGDKLQEKIGDILSDYIQDVDKNSPFATWSASHKIKILILKCIKKYKEGGI